MKRVTFFILLFQLGLVAFGERIDGPANVRTAPKGTSIISLNDNVLVDCSELKAGWYTIAINIKLTKEQYDSSIPVKEGDSLFNSQDEFIGTALITIPDSLQSTWYTGGAVGNPRRYGMNIFASTYKSNIKPESIPELQLKSILTAISKPTREDLTNFISEFRFRDSGLLDRLVEGYDEKMIYESTVIDPSPMDRIRFIFKASELVAIVHTRPISHQLTSQPLIRGRKIIIIQEMTSGELENFLEINRNAYAGID
jgi:hypothetical protein